MYSGCGVDSIDFSGNQVYINYFQNKPKLIPIQNPNPIPPPSENSSAISNNRCYFRKGVILKPHKDITNKPTDIIKSPDEEIQHESYKQQQDQLYNQSIKRCEEEAFANIAQNLNQDYVRNRLKAIKTEKLW